MSLQSFQWTHGCYSKRLKIKIDLVISKGHISKLGNSFQEFYFAYCFLLEEHIVNASNCNLYQQYCLLYILRNRSYCFQKYNRLQMKRPPNFRAVSLNFGIWRFGNILSFSIYIYVLTYLSYTLRYTKIFISTLFFFNIQRNQQAIFSYFFLSNVFSIFVFKLLIKSTYPLLSHIVDDNRDDKPGNRANSIGQTHQNGRVSRRNVQMVNVVPWYSKTTTGHAEGQLDCCYVLKNIFFYQQQVTWRKGIQKELCNPIKTPSKYTRNFSAYYIVSSAN